MSEDQFVKLFKYIEGFRKDVDRRFEEATHDRADIRATVGELASQVKEYREEVSALTASPDQKPSGKQ